MIFAATCMFTLFHFHIRFGAISFYYNMRICRLTWYATFHRSMVWWRKVRRLHSFRVADNPSGGRSPPTIFRLGRFDEECPFARPVTEVFAVIGANTKGPFMMPCRHYCPWAMSLIACVLRRFVVWERVLWFYSLLLFTTLVCKMTQTNHFLLFLAVAWECCRVLYFVKQFMH